MIPKLIYDRANTVVHLASLAIMGIGFLMQYFQIPFAVVVSLTGGIVSFGMFGATFLLHISTRIHASSAPDKLLTYLASIFCFAIYGTFLYFIQQLSNVPVATLGGLWGLIAAMLVFIVMISEDIFASTFTVASND